VRLPSGAARDAELSRAVESATTDVGPPALLLSTRPSTVMRARCILGESQESQATLSLVRAASF
jgi:hypothetical protein